ncbi:glycoside hydrolase family 5 protein [Roseateles sp. DC23W]|uniref:Glycoside hydrolase family 5 protein n=1 Tax=Pelomonas dachongensis TaxID=3299029 RepID=A0ABW7ELC5_9BURK
MKAIAALLLALASLATQAAPWREVSSPDLAREMAPGWNLGNSLEAIGGETAWGNARTTKPLIQAVKAAGFKCIRIPVAWRQYTDTQGRIKPEWMARVSEVVGWAREAGLIVMINIHWDGGWMQPTAKHQNEVNRHLALYWTQIAEHFKDHDEGLLFAGTNEVMVEGDYGKPTAEYVRAQNSFNQTFVTTVRATGGHNPRRHLVVQGFNTNIDHTVDFAVLPQDPTPGRLMMEVHYYDPYEFTLNNEGKVWQWGRLATDTKATAPWGGESHADQQFDKMKARFVDRGVPVILGEYGAVSRPSVPGAARYRVYWNAYVTRSAQQRGLVPVYWDNGVFNKPEGFAIFDRATGEVLDAELLRAIVGGVNGR